MPAAEAEKAKTAKNYDDARAHLDSAISNLKMAMVLIHQHRAYGELKASLAAQIAGAGTAERCQLPAAAYRRR